MQHVGPADQVQHRPPARRGASGRGRRCGARGSARRRRWRHPQARPARPVDPQHLGAEVGEQHRGERRRADAGQLHHPQAGEGPLVAGCRTRRGRGRRSCGHSGTREPAPRSHRPALRRSDVVTLPPFQLLVDAHWRDVARLAHALAGPVDGDDVAQQAWTQALCGVPLAALGGNLRGWLLTITSRCAMDVHRGRARRAVPTEDVTVLSAASRRPRARPARRPTGRTSCCGPGSPRCRSASGTPWSSSTSPTSTTPPSPAPRHLAHDEPPARQRRPRDPAEGVHEHPLTDAPTSPACWPVRPGGGAAGAARVGRLLRRGGHRRSDGCCWPATRPARWSPPPSCDRCDRGGLAAAAGSARSPRACCAGRPRWTRPAASSRRTSPASAGRSTCGSTSPRDAVPAGGAHRAARSVGYGERTTYGALARRVGRPTASRAVGAALGANPLCVVLPCHRVVASSGALTGYAGGLPAKERLLALESG